MAGKSGTGKSGTTYRYYKCVSVKHHRGCDKESVRKGWIEGAVIFMARKIIFDDDLIEDIAQAVEEQLCVESTALAALRAQYDATQKSLNKLLRAIEHGILTPTTKQRMEQLEEEKKELSVQIAKEELAKPKLTKNQIIFWLDIFTFPFCRQVVFAAGAGEPGSGKCKRIIQRTLRREPGRSSRRCIPCTPRSPR